MPDPGIRSFTIAAKYQFSPVETFAVNGTQILLIGGIPSGLIGNYRVNRAWVQASAIPNDADGTMLLNLLVRDNTEGSTDTLVDSANLETIVNTAYKWFELPFVVETVEKERIISPGDSLRCTLVNDSAAIDTNPLVQVCIELLPLINTNDDYIQPETTYLEQPS